MKYVKEVLKNGNSDEKFVEILSIPFYLTRCNKLWGSDKGKTQRKFY